MKRPFLIPALVLFAGCLLVWCVGCNDQVTVDNKPCCPNGRCCPAGPCCPAPQPKVRIDISPVIVPREPAPIIVVPPAPHCPPHKEPHR